MKSLSVAAAVVMALVVGHGAASTASTKPRISWWTVQGASPSTDAANLAAMKEHPAVFSAMQPYLAAFDSCADGNVSLCWGRDTAVKPYVAQLHALGIEVLPAIFNSANATQMHIVQANLTAWVADAVAVAKHYGFDGVHIDYEPQWPTDPAPDAPANFAVFLKALSDAMQAAGMRVTVAVATWSNVLNNAQLLASSGVSELQDMETYGAATPALVAQLYDGVKAATGKLDAAGIGMGPYESSWTPANLNSTLAYLQAQGGSRVDIFRLLMDGSNNWPAPWWYPALEAFAAGAPIGNE